jgi:NADPH:quinone reductase-like Zn-dependent oxidoreductase
MSPMRAVVIDQHGSNVRYTEDFLVPEPGEGCVRVQVRAAALNRLDLWVRDGIPGLKLHMPHILGADAAGEVAHIGNGVTEFTVGDRVVVNPGMFCGKCDMCRSGHDNLCQFFGILGEHTPGTLADYLVVPARNLLKLPSHVPFADAAAASLVYLTAWHSLITRGRLKAGESVLVVGSGGGVNSASIQIAKLAGAKVYAVASNAEKAERAKALSADVVIDRSAEDWSKAIFKATDRRGVDVVVDNVGKDTLFNSIRSVRRGGRILIVGNTSGYDAQIDLRYIFSKQIEIIGSTMAPHADFVTVMQMVFEGRLKPVIGARFALADAAQAIHTLEHGDVFGKIVLEW